MSSPEWIQTWHPALENPQPWDPTLMQRFAAEGKAAPSAACSVDDSREHSIPPAPSSPPPASPTLPPPPPTDAIWPSIPSEIPTLSLAPAQYQIEPERLAESASREGDTGVHDLNERTNPDQNEAGDEASRPSDSGSEMSLSSVSDAPIIHSSENAHESSRTPTANTHVDLDLLDLLPSTVVKPLPFIDPLDPFSFGTQPIANLLNSSTDIMSPPVIPEDFFSAIAEPQNPTLMQSSMSASQLPSQSNSIHAPNASKKTNAVSSLTTDTSAETTNAQTTTTETSTISPLATNPSNQATHTNTAISQERAPIPDNSTPQNTTSDTQNRLPASFLNQPLWRLANLSLRSSNMNVDGEAQRQHEQRRDKAYNDGIEAAKSCFKEGAKDCMINGNEVVEDPYGQRDEMSWEEVYRPGYKPNGRE